MKRRFDTRILPILILCLLALLCGCGITDNDPAISSDTTTAAAEAPRPMPEPGPDALEVDGREIGQVYLLEGVEYLEAGALTEHWDLTVTEPEPGALRWSRIGFDVEFRDGSEEVKTPDAQPLHLTAPVLHGEDRWYLPLSVFEDFLPRRRVDDVWEQRVRFLKEEPGPVLRWNGGDPEESVLLGGAPVVTSTFLLEKFGAEAEERTEERGVTALMMRLMEHELTVRTGSLHADLDGEALDLAVPACRDENGVWSLPVSLLKKFDCVILENPEERLLELWRISEGPDLWLDGTGMGKALLCGETPCVPLPAAAAALEGILPQNSHAWLLIVGDHTLSFFPGSKEAEVDGEAVILPAPAILWKEEPLIPVEFLAETLDIPKLEGEDLIFSRMEVRDTRIWVDGKEAASFVRGESPLYLRLNNICLPEEKPTELWPNSAEFLLLEKRLFLTGGSETLQIDDEEVILADPVLVDGETWYVPAELLTVLDLTELEDPDLDQLYYTKIVQHEDLAEGYRVPVLMYHAVSDNIWGIPELFISPSTLEQQLQAIVEGGYTAITFEDLDRIGEIEKPVMLTFDDGYDDNFTELFPLLQKYNVKATVFVIVNDLGKNHKLTKEQVREMSDSGLVSIQSHTMSHSYLDEMYETQLIREHYDSMIGLARITGKQPFVMCYPTGRSSGYSRNITAQYYEYGLCMGGPCWVTGDAPYRIYRYYIPRKTTLDTFLSYLEG